MLSEYEIENGRLKKFIFWPLFKLISAFILAIVASLVLLDVGQGKIVFVLGLTCIWIFLVHLLPFFLLTWRHLAISKGVRFDVYNSSTNFRYRNGHDNVEFNLAEVDRIVCVLSPPKNDNRMDLAGFGHFFYWKIFLKNGLVLRLSCLVVDEEVFYQKEIQREKRIFPFPSK